MKKCSKCLKEKPATSDYFPAYKKWLRSKCKTCFSKEKKQYREINKDSISEKNKRYHEINRENCLKRNKQWCDANKKQRSEKGKQRYKENRVKFAEYRAANKDRIAEYHAVNKDRVAEYRVVNKEKIKERHKEWERKNKDKVNCYKQKRLSKKKKLPSTLTADQWRTIKEQFNHKCAYCGEEKPLSQDHFHPLSKGGYYDHNNIIPACLSCNSSKRDKSFFEWYPRHKSYSKMREKAILRHLNYNERLQQLALI